MRVCARVGVHAGGSVRWLMSAARRGGACRRAAGCEHKCGLLRGGGGGVDWRSLVSVSTRQECVSVRSGVKFFWILQPSVDR